MNRMTMIKSCALGLVLGAMSLLPTQAKAFDRYSRTGGGDGTNCSACHGDFRNTTSSQADGQTWSDNLHNVHRRVMVASAGGNSDCNVCHAGNSRMPVMMNMSAGGSGLSTISCMGCHGRNEDNVNANPDVPGKTGYGAGLRQHHSNAGVNSCKGCHADAEPLAYTPVPENVLPDYYANPGTNHPVMPTDSCNPAGSENFEGLAQGLDNDGNGFYDQNDTACMPSFCGDGVVDPGEACDTAGESATCNLDCTVALCGDSKINQSAGETCDDGGESATCDIDCTAATCGDATINVSAGEVCDGNCPSSCDDGKVCTTDSMAGSALACSAVCSNVSITACVGGDGCCAPGCDASNDSDCGSPNLCGNGVIDQGELCDGNCPTSCDDGNACTTDAMSGSAATCDAVCASTAITVCGNGDGCCPSACSNASDNDCSLTCGNGVLDAGETCDPVDTCPTSCDDGNACTTDSMTGSAANCNAACSNIKVTTCVSDDGCCPTGCDAASDNDCSLTCGNGVVDPGETCDPAGSCPTSCDDGNACTNDVLTGNAQLCSAECSYNYFTSCTNDDGCCPTGCTEANDNDCGAGGNGGSSSGTGCGCNSSDGANAPFGIGLMLAFAGLCLFPMRKRLRK